MSLDIETTITPEVTLLRCSGRLVLGQGTDLLRETVWHALAGGRAVALDLGGLTQVDAHGAGVLAELCAIARQASRVLMLADVNPRVGRLLRLTQLDAVLARASEPALHAAR